MKITPIAEELKKDFPSSEKVVFFDHAGVAPITKRAYEKVAEFSARLKEPGEINPQKFLEEIEQARSVCAHLLGAEPDSICFVRSTSFGISLVASGLRWKQGDNIITYSREFPANIYPWLNIAKKGVEIRLIPERDGRIVFEDIEKLVNSRTRLIAISSVQFTNGFRIDLKRLSEFCRARGILLLVDAIQSLGIIPFNLAETPVDFVCADGHKWLLSFEGMGILYINPRLIDELDLHIVGWNSVVDAHDFLNYNFQLRPDARRFEEGSYNTISILALSASVSLLLDTGIETLYERVLALGDILIEELEKMGAKILSSRQKDERSGIISFIFEGKNPNELCFQLRQKGAICSARGRGVRLSPHGYQNEEDVERFLKIVREVV